MIKYAIAYLLLILSLNSLAQEVKEIKYDKEYEINPEPNKGIDHFQNYIEKNLEIPTSVMSNLRDGSVLFKILINDEGILTDVIIDEYLRDKNLKENTAILIRKYFNEETWRPAVVNNVNVQSEIRGKIEIIPRKSSGYFKTHISIIIVDKPKKSFSKARIQQNIKFIIKSCVNSVKGFDTQTTFSFDVSENGGMINLRAESESQYALQLVKLFEEKMRNVKWMPAKLNKKKISTKHVVTITNYPIIKPNHPLVK